MKKLLRLLIVMAVAWLPLVSQAQGWPANYGGVMLQGFYWDSFQLDYASMLQSDWSNPYWEVPRTTWSVLNSTAVRNQITPFIDLIWLPQSGASTAPDKSDLTGAGQEAEQMITENGKNKLQIWKFTNGEKFSVNSADRMGFIPVWWFDHGKGLSYSWDDRTYESKSAFGTEAELRALLRDYAAARTYALEDVVINHKGGPGMWNGSGKGRYLIRENSATGKPADESNCDVTWNYDTNEDIVDDAAHDYYSQKPYLDGGNIISESGFTGGNWGKDLRHDSENVRENVVKYLNFLKNDLGYAGFRYDYVKGYDPKYLAQYNVATRPTFSVGEFFDGDQKYLESWINKTYADGNIQSAAFDFPLKFAMNNAFSPASGNNYQGLDNVGLVSNYKMRRYAVTFVDNHDTFKNIPSDDTHRGFPNRISHHVVEANMFILGMPGTPCLFYPHYMNQSWQPVIQKCIKARRAAGITNQAAISLVEKKGSNGIRFLITGTKGKCVMQLGSEAQAEGTPAGFQLVATEGDCSFYITAGLDWENVEKDEQINGFAIVDQPSGNYDAAFTVNIAPSNSSTRVVYTTDGTNPDAGSYPAGAGTSVTVNSNMTIKAGVVVNGVVDENSIVTRTYVMDGNNQSGKVKVYISYGQNAAVTDEYSTKPSIYAWKNVNGKDKELTKEWPGWTNLGNTETVAGVEWYVATIDAVGFDMLLHRGGENKNMADVSKSATIENVTHDIFLTYTDGVAHDVTAVYGGALHDPKLSIDVPSGSYDGSLKVKLMSTLDGSTATDPKATIVYTVSTAGGQMPAKPSTTISANSGSFEGHGTVTINADNASGSTFYLRAAIVKDGKLIDEQARSYFIKKVNAPKSGIHIYVKNMTTADEPDIYAWNGDTFYNGNWPGNAGSETRTAYGQTWSYYHIDSNSANVIFSLGSDLTKTADISINGAGDYFYYYYPGAYQFKKVNDEKTESSHAYNSNPGYIDVSNSSTKTTTTKAYPFFLKGSEPGNAVIHAWGSTTHSTVWGTHPFNSLPTTTVNGQQWYYLTCIDADYDVKNVILYKKDNDGQRKEQNNLNEFSGRATSSIAYSYFFTYPNNGTWTDIAWNTDNASHAYNALSGQTPSTAAGDAAATLKYVSYTGLPSCVTPIEEGREGFYFENDKDYGLPYAWVYNGTTAYSGNAWPGEQLLEVVGTANNGNTIYRWTWNGEGSIPEAAKVIFSNNGDNTTQTNPDGMGYVRNGYYTSTGSHGAASGNFLTLASLISQAAAGKVSTTTDYTISNNLIVAYVNSANGLLYAKDSNGDALNLSVPAADERVEDMLATRNFDQSNWVAIRVLNSGTSSNYDHSTLMGGTINGRFSYENGNPVLSIDGATVQYEPVYDANTVAYDGNLYFPAHFVDEHKDAHDQKYFFVTPKKQEYARITDAVYFNGAVYEPTKSKTTNTNDLPGAVSVVIDRDYYNDVALVNNNYYDLTVIVRGKAASAGAPARRADAKVTPVSTEYELVVIKADRKDAVVTGVEDVSNVRTVESVHYVDLTGRVSTQPHSGVNIVVTRYTDGTQSTAKVLK